MSKIKDWLEDFFLPKSYNNSFNSQKYISDIENGIFRDKFCLGVTAKDSGSWVLQDFVLSANALYVGKVGSGKSTACQFTLLTWMLTNSDQTTLFIVDTMKGAQDYKPLFDCSQVYPIVSNEEGVHRVLDLLYDEMVERKNKFTELGVKDTKEYEKKIKKKITKYIVLFEEFHGISATVLNYDKDYKTEGTTAFKFHTIMRVGRAFGIWVFACSQKSTKEDIPKEIVSNFNQKQIFAVSAGESNYVLGSNSASLISPDSKGRCFNSSDQEVQFPYIEQIGTIKLIEKYVKENTAVSLRLNPQMIADVLQGKSLKQQYKYKKMTELVKRFHQSLDSKVVISILHDKIGCFVEEKNSMIDKFCVDMIVTWPNKEQTCVFVLNDKKVTEKHLQRMVNAVSGYECSRGVIYTKETPSQSVYRKAVQLNIEIVDYEDLVRLANKVEHYKETGETVEFTPDKLASDEKESGEYFTDHPEIKDDSEIDSCILDIVKKSKEELESENKKIIENDNNDEFINKSLLEDAIKESKKEIEDQKIFADEVDVKILNETDQNKSPELKETSIATQIQNELSINTMVNLTKQKRPTVMINITPRIKKEDSPVILVTCLKTESGEPFRIIFYCLFGTVCRHKYFIDRKVSSEFSHKMKIRLGISSKNEWNKDPFVFDENDFKKALSVYLDNYDVVDNNIKVVFSNDDLSVFEQYIKENSGKFVPRTIEKYIEDIFSIKKTKDEIKEMFDIADDNSNFFNESEVLFKIWVQGG